MTNQKAICRSLTLLLCLIWGLFGTSLAMAQHGGGGHGGGGHGGGGHGGGGHGGGGHGGGGHGGGGHGGGGHGGGGHGGGHYGGGHGGGGYGGGHYGGYGGGHYGGYGGGHYGGYGHGSVHLDLGFGHGGGYGHGGYYGYGGHHDYHHYFYPFYASTWYGGYGNDDYGYGGYGGYGYLDSSRSYCDYYQVASTQVASEVDVLPSAVLQADDSNVLSSEPDQLPAAIEQTVAKPVSGPDYGGEAKRAFRSNDLAGALRMINHALVEMPREGKLYLFKGQILFAVGEYQRAAIAIHQAASLLEKEDWGYVVQKYRDYYRGQHFVQQMDKLKVYLKENPDSAPAHFVRGYQHGYLGHHKTALRALTRTLELEGRDQLAAELIRQFGGTVPEQAVQSTESEESSEQDATPPATSEHSHAHESEAHDHS